MTPGFLALRSLKRSQTREERCELCSVAVGQVHPHLLEVESGSILCACDACAILFSYRDSGRRLLRIPRSIRRLPDFNLDDAEWNALALPIDMAFFVKSTKAGRVLAYYPSPAGPTESLLDLEAWEDLVRENPVLGEMQPDVEALVVNRARGHRIYVIAPVDECYRLTGLIRTHWHGMSGGDSVWSEIDHFFERMEETAHA